MIYSLDVRLFQDSDGDGIGDLCGLTSRLDHLSRLGVSILWLNPIHPTPYRDGGYDVTDYYGVDESLGNLGDFAEFMAECDERGIRVMLDLVLNHTSDEHPWFRAARTDPQSPYRDWYVWADEEPPDRLEGMVFPGVQEATWTYDETAGAWYHHRFYPFQPDLNSQNQQVRSEMKKVVTFWERLGVSGFRLDGAPFLIEKTEPGEASCHGTTASSSSCASGCRGHVGTRCSWRRHTSPRTSSSSSSATRTGRPTGCTCSSPSASTRR